MTNLRPIHAFLAAGVLLAAASATPVMLSTAPGSVLHPAIGDGNVVGITRSFEQPAGFTANGFNARFQFTDIGILDAHGSALVIIAPGVGYSLNEIEQVLYFLQRGGRVLIADDGGVAHELLAQLGVGVSTTVAHVYTPGFSVAPHRIVALSTGVLPGMPDEVVVSRPVAVNGGIPLLVAPELAWLDENENGKPDLGEPIERGLVLAASVRVGAGELIVVGDPGAVGSSSPDSAAALFDHVADGGRVLVFDEAHRPRSDPLGANGMMAGKATVVTRLSVLIFVSASVGAVVLAPRLEVARRRRRKPLDGKKFDPNLLQEVLSELESS